MHGLDLVLFARDIGVVSCVVDDIEEAVEILGVDGGRDGEAGHADVADMSGTESGTDGAVRARRVGFDEDGCFHRFRC